MGLVARKPVLLSYRDQLKNSNFTHSKLTYDTFQKANNKGADQTAQAGLGLCCSNTPEDRFSHVEVHIISEVHERMNAMDSVQGYLHHNRNCLSQFHKIPWDQTSDVQQGSTLMM